MEDTFPHPFQVQHRTRELATLAIGVQDLSTEHLLVTRLSLSSSVIVKGVFESEKALL